MNRRQRRKRLKQILTPQYIAASVEAYLRYLGASPFLDYVLGKNQQGQFQAANLTTAPAGGTGSDDTSLPPLGPSGIQAPCKLDARAPRQTAVSGDSQDAL